MLTQYLGEARRQLGPVATKALQGLRESHGTAHVALMEQRKALATFSQQVFKDAVPYVRVCVAALQRAGAHNS